MYLGCSLKTIHIGEIVKLTKLKKEKKDDGGKFSFSVDRPTISIVTFSSQSEK
jgi:hypothetical protein